MTEFDPVLVGKITRPHGVRGEMRVMEGSGSSGAWRQLDVVYIGRDVSCARTYNVRGVRGAGKFAILAIEGVEDRNRAENFRGLKIFVDRIELPSDDDGSYYAADLIGLDVVDTNGRALGKLIEIFENGAHEVYVVRGSVAEVLLPVVPGVVVEINLDDAVLVVDPPDGLPGIEG